MRIICIKPIAGPRQKRHLGNGFDAMEHWKKFVMITGAVAALMSIMIGWQQLSFLPRWAWYDEVAAVQDFATGTRVLVLGQEWERLDNQISRLEERQQLSPEERDLLSKLRWRQKEVEAQLEALRQQNGS